MLKKFFRLKFHYLFIPLLLTFLLFVTSFLFVFLPSFENSIKERKKELIREIVNSAWNTVDFYYQKSAKNEMSVHEAQDLAKKHIENIRYGIEN
ncbi:MAG: cache domain-containing protein, partial [Bacteroidota bacterium]